MKKNQQLFSAETLFALLAFFMITVGCKKTDVSALSLSSSSNDEAISLSGYKQVNLAANTTSFGAERIDPRLQNAWGMSADDEGEIWVSANETGLSFVYDITGAHLMPPVTIPSHSMKIHGNPTGNIGARVSSLSAKLYGKTPGRKWRAGLWRSWKAATNPFRARKKL